VASDDILYQLLRYLPDPRTDEELEKVTEQFKSGGLLERERLGESKALDALLRQAIVKRGSRPDFPLNVDRTMENEYVNLMGLAGGVEGGSRLEANPEAFWPEGSKVRYGKSYFKPGQIGVNGYVSSDDPSLANIGTLRGTTLPHELTHTGQLSTKGGLYNKPEEAPEFKRAIQGVYDVVSTNHDLADTVPSNMFQDPHEFVAALMGEEGAQPSEADLKNNPLLGFIYKDPALKQWYLDSTNRWDETTSKPQKSREVAGKIGDTANRWVNNILPPAITKLLY